MINTRKLIVLVSAIWLAPGWAAGIASAHPLATQAGVEILKNDGNAFDAAVAMTAALAVVEPYSSGLGGGGFYLLYDAENEEYTFIDARERAPGAAHRDMYLDKQGQIIPNASIDGPLAAGIPGIPAALEHLAKEYGTLDLQTLLTPAHQLASEGFEVDRIYHELSQARLEVLSRFPSSRAIFLNDGQAFAPGERIIQTDLAKTIETLAKKGAKEFYQGKMAKELVRAVRADGGIWTMADLADYQIIERVPMLVNFGFGVLHTAPPPSSGGVALAQIFGQLDSLGVLGTIDLTDAQDTHLLIEAMRRAYRDRAVYLGDSDYVDIPIGRLTSPHYAAGLAAGIHPEKATRSDSLSNQATPKKSNHTSHFSICDSKGNMVSATLSINYSFGSGMVAGNTGILLNDEMDDFVAKPNAQNLYGLIGGHANAIEPGKRMLSSMSPSIVEFPDRTVILGTPGGSRIITMVAQSVLEALAGGSAKEIANKARIHHQFVPDTVWYEPDAISAPMLQTLQDMGHTLKKGRIWGNMQVVVISKDGRTDAASDERGIGQVWVQE